MWVPPHLSQHNVWFDARSGSGTMAQHRIKIEQIGSTRTSTNRSYRRMPAQCWAGIRDTEPPKTQHWNPSHAALTLGLRCYGGPTQRQHSPRSSDHVVPAGVTLENYQHKHNTTATRCRLSEHETTSQC